MANHNIQTVEDLRDIESDLVGSYYLMNDLDLSGENWEPIGSGVSDFNGVFDGQGYTISNLTYDDTVPGLGVGGLFGRVIGGEIKNLTLNGIDITGKRLVGTLIARVDMGSSDKNLTVNNVSINDVAIGEQDSDGLTESGGVIGSCNASGSYVVDFSDCSIDGLQMTSSSDVSTYLGGFSGYFGGTLRRCHATGGITGANGNVGGLIGSADIIDIMDCCVDVDIVGDSSGHYIGGFIGSVDSGSADVSIINCYSAGVIVSGDNSYGIGGFLGGIVLNDLNSLSIINSYSIGHVSCLGTSVGGFIGGVSEGVGWETATLNVSNCAWYTSAFYYAVGTTPLASGINLGDLDWGIDETDDTKFYSSSHPVYAQEPEGAVRDEEGNIIRDDDWNILIGS
jgi:fibronectin-binding autotransporter adhesin